ncbi:hypothetical protein CRG98_018092 [Punica granatum]|uniref:Uncharacterized protein n=1 Tax=Punica granatum TaxID=22663 RepID=A0A2I0JYU8_PUNGR|nr:hypothetical protein CRG98_018092 [Punica granatum]
MWTLVGAHMRAFGSRGLGVSTFPWGRVTGTHEKESPLIILRPEGYEERVEEVFESRVTRWSPWMDDSGREKAWNARLGAREDVWRVGRCQARVDARYVMGACVHACTRKNVRGARRAQELPRSDWRCTSARTGMRTMTGARLCAWAGDECTVHLRPRSSPKMIETT